MALWDRHAWPEEDPSMSAGRSDSTISVEVLLVHWKADELQSE